MSLPSVTGLNNLVVAPPTHYRAGGLGDKAGIVINLVLRYRVESTVETLLVPVLERLAKRVLTAELGAFEPIGVFKLPSVVETSELGASSSCHLTSILWIGRVPTYFS